MKFIDSKHKEFWNNKYKEMEQMGKTDVYYKAIVYTLGICETTRDNFSKIFNLLVSRKFVKMTRDTITPTVKFRNTYRVMNKSFNIADVSRTTDNMSVF